MDSRWWGSYLPRYTIGVMVGVLYVLPGAMVYVIGHRIEAMMVERYAATPTPTSGADPQLLQGANE